MASPEVLSALETLHREIEKLEPAIKHVETAQQVTQTVKAIPQKYIEFLNEVKISDAKHKEELTILFEKEVSSFTEENIKLQKTTSEIQKQVKLEQEGLAKLKETILVFHNNVEKINFPKRLEDLDSGVSVNLNAIISIQGRLDLIESNITDKFKDLQKYEIETRGELEARINKSKNEILMALDSASNKHQKFSYVTWVLTIITFILLFLFR